jgi:DNA topoisomerase-1
LEKWKTLRHNGVVFPEYGARGLSITIKRKKIALNPEQEEMAYAWAKKLSTPYVQDPVFVNNFLKDFLQVLPPEFANAKMEEIDFSEIVKYQEEEKIRNSQPEVKKQLAAARKERRLALKEKFGYAEMDNVKTEVANYMVEPASIFMGRGQHPFRGKWKAGAKPEDVTVNLDENAPIPPCPVPGKKWGQIIHDRNSTWIARWIDKLTEKEKYIWLSDVSPIRQSRDKAKYDKAKDLEKTIERVRKHISKGMESKDPKERKIAVVCYLIDKLAMRVGDEKDEDEADTVGATTLRVEHIKTTGTAIEFDFLGKDSVRWQKTLEVDSDKRILENLREFCAGKNPSDLIFDGITSDAVNRFLGNCYEGLTAKVFRTFHATNIVKGYLISLNGKITPEASNEKKLYYARHANLQAAIKCNHKRTPPKNWEQALQKKEERLKTLESQTGKTEKAEERRKESMEKLKLNLEIAKQTRDYNLNTSLRNYIDPRIYKSWADSVGLDWKVLYTKTLQRKFEWVNRSRLEWGSQ